MADNIALGFGVLVALGGVAGYATKKSVPSLVAGITSGSFLSCSLEHNKIYAAQLAATNPRLASQIIIGICALLTAVMGLRFKNTGKFMPAGLVAILAALMTIRSFFSLQ